MESALNITGECLIGGKSVRGSGPVFMAFDPSAGSHIAPGFNSAGYGEVDQACSLAREAFGLYRATSVAQRASLLEAIAQSIDELQDELIVRAMHETGLPRARLEGERGRTTGQLKLFAKLLRQGSWLDVRIDTALPDRKPLPRPDLRMQRIALGPVAVFGASNFPLAFSVAGGDTASALAAGCPVVVKAHPAHPGTSELVGRAIQRAVERCNMPAGVFSMLTGPDNALGVALVSHPAIRAVGFTGSRGGGKALMAVAAARPEPIPVYAEMSSINPMFVLPHALDARAEALAAGFIDSLTMGVGQLCTNPGLVLAMRGPALDRFRSAAVAQLSQRSSATMLSAGIHDAYERGVGQLKQQAAVEPLAGGVTADGSCQATPNLFATTAQAFLDNATLSHEVFGPVSLLVVCENADEMLACARHIEGQLTCTLHMEPADFDLAHRLLPLLEQKAGRILANGFPTGVEVASAMVHGGPFPATSDGRSTSVGTAAIERFLRPICYQNLPQDLLPPALRDGNPERIPHQRDGELIV